MTKAIDTYVSPAKRRKAYVEEVVKEGVKKEDVGNNFPRRNIFDFTDVDRDGTISTPEIQRCSSPVLFKNTKTGSTRAFDVNNTENPFYYSGLDIDENEIQLYNGLKKRRS